MDSFIIKNDTWLRYLPIILYGLIIILAAMSVAIVFLIYRRYKNQNLKSRNGKSDFAAAYEESRSSNGSKNRNTAAKNPQPELPAHFGEPHGPAVAEFYFEYEDTFRI